VWFDYFATETQAKYESRLTGLLAKYPDDLSRFEPDDLEHWQAAPADGPRAQPLVADLWGSVWQSSPDSVGRNFERPVLADWRDLDDYLARTPDPRRAGRFEKAGTAAAQADDRYKLGIFWLALFERLHMIRGMDRLFADFYESPHELSRLLDVLQEYLLATIDAFASIGMDGVLLGEDWGMQDRLMISPAMWRDWFKPRYAEVFDRIHGHGMDVWLHSCGHVGPIIGDFVDLGLDVLHPLQYGCVDWEWVSQEFRGQLSFLGCVDVAHVLPSGAPESIRSHVARIVDLFGSPRGGLVLTVGNTIMPETPWENIEALFEAMARYRTHAAT